jgi:hypothetical protein
MEGRPSEALAALAAIYEGGGELRQVVRGLMERCRDLLVAAIESRDAAVRARLSAALDALLHLDGEVRRHAEPRFLVEATLVRLAVETAAPAPSAVVAQPPPVPVGGKGDGRVAPIAPATGPIEAAPQPPPTPVGANSDARVAPPAPPTAEPADGWRGVLDALKPKVRAYFLEARPQLSSDTLVLSFPYGFHHKMASEHIDQIQPLVKAWLGEGATVDLRLESATRASGPAAAVERPPAPEEDPLVKAAERKLEGRVVRVRHLKES